MMFNLSRNGYYADFVLVPLFVVAISSAAFLFWAFIGFLAWTFFEYIVHRSLFHRVKAFNHDHNRHHDEPESYIGVGSWITLPLFLLLWALAGDAVTIGFAVGYYIYIFVHDQFHHARLQPGDWLYSIFHHHALHHRNGKTNFGVSVIWWDIIFRTRN